MSENYLFVEVSGNKKLGPIPAVYVSSNTCPDACPLKDGKGCYAACGRTALHWKRVDAGQNTLDITQLYHRIKGMRKKSLWRYAVVGDLPGDSNRIDVSALEALTEANKGKSVISFTHKPVGPESVDAIFNAKAVEKANKNGFTINLSADNIQEADELADLGIAPVVVVLPTNAPEHPTKTPKGRTVAVCPAERNKKVRCADCGICANPNRKVIVAFRAHGALRNHINRRLLPMVSNV